MEVFVDFHHVENRKEQNDTIKKVLFLAKIMPIVFIV